MAKEARTGLEMMLIPLIRSMGLDPEQLKAILVDIGGKVTEFDNRMARLEMQNNEILARLPIKETESDDE